ncbi:MULTISPECIES: IclR family transcriptional regulator [unclassified Cryobacterium]|uniref:IclR family transcriptional regulator n=1 Tax=unclassified Cryobacterium TaxID=2649013 RepID=UPI001069D7A9|nr:MULTISPECIES: IclR family transcriptional regulator [unclassified Cryobacterium]TFD02982.1 IclR family transcriptional regulator [Cryobacterium sp. TMT1-66-1]TFD15333.1 IclR family transcriptional regulator [Cryobacterium sp. TMT1-2-2]
MENARLRRIFDVLGRLATDGPQTVTEMSNALSLPMSSTHDLLKAMVKGGMASVTTHGYDVGPATLRLSLRVQERLNIVNAATVELQKLAARIGFDVYLAIQTGNDVVYAARFRGRRGIKIDIPIGLPLYRHATAVGKLLAAYDLEFRQETFSGNLKALTPRTHIDRQSLTEELDRIRSNGFSISREEAVLGIVGIATPIWANGRIVGIAHISALRSEVNDDRLAELAVELQRTSAVIEEQILGLRSADARPLQIIDHIGPPIYDGAYTPQFR